MLPLATTRPMAGLAAKLVDRAQNDNRPSEARHAKLDMRTISFRVKCRHRPDDLPIIYRAPPPVVASGLVDIHSHILSGLDDGARTLEDSVEAGQDMTMDIDQ